MQAVQKILDMFPFLKMISNQEIFRGINGLHFYVLYSDTKKVY